MSRMWSPTDRFNAQFVKLPAEKQALARQKMLSVMCVTLRVAQGADGDVVELIEDQTHPPLNIRQTYDAATASYRFSDDDYEYFIGAPPVVHHEDQTAEEAFYAQIGKVGSAGDGFGFAAALICLKDGEAVARRGWNASGQFVCMMPALHLPPFNTQDTNRKVNDRTAKWIGPNQPLDCQPYFALYNAQKKWQPGWVPSTGDLLAEDWFLFEIKYD